MTDDYQPPRRQLISCNVCGATDRLLRCSKCKIALYCSQTHQRSDWRSHKVECRKFTTNNNLASNSNSNNSTVTSITTTTASSANSTLLLTADSLLLSPASSASISSTSPETSIPNNEAVNHQHHHHHHHHQQHHQQHQSIISQATPAQESNTAAASKDHSTTQEATNTQILNNSTIEQPALTSVSVSLTASTPATPSNSNLNRLGIAETNVSAASSTASTSTASAEDEIEKNNRLYRSLADNSMPISNDNILSPNLTPSEMGHEDLCKHVIDDLNMYGLSVIDDFLGKHKGLEILSEVHNMHTAGVFKDGQLVSKAVAERDLRTIRGDKITWVKGTEPGCINVGYLINQVDNVVILANKMQNNGTLGNYKIRERTKAMVACYPGSGAHYVMHVDNPNKDGRVITAIYYLNLNWDTKRSGGVLRIFPEHAGTVADIEPKFDRIIFFWSDRRNPHEVQPSHRTRYAITVWYFDAEERELALNRYKNHKTKN